MSIYYDPTRNVYVDTESGAIIPIDESDAISGAVVPHKKRNNDHIDSDHALALSLAEMESANHTENHNQSFNEVGRSYSNPSESKSFFGQIMDRINQGDYVFRRNKSRRSMSYLPTDNEEPPPDSDHDDWFLARALQAMEFEIHEDLNPPMNPSASEADFNKKELKASSCITQMTTISTLVVLIQIGVLIAMIQVYGYAPRYVNPMIGPDAQALVNFGAKEAGLIIGKGQWWRCLTAVFLHAGVLHLLSNGAIQLRVGGYLNQVYGNISWVLIYFVSGFFGNMMRYYYRYLILGMISPILFLSSCIFSADSISVGSSGAVLGMLSSWIVWILFRWNRIPERARGNRNCQLAVVLACVAITLGTSFSKYIDWAAHYGGASMGILWGILLISRELQNENHKLAVRIISMALISGFLTWALYTMIALQHPKIILEPTNM